MELNPTPGSNVSRRIRHSGIPASGMSPTVCHDVTEDYRGGLIEFNSDYDISVVSKKRLGMCESNWEIRICDRLVESKEEYQATEMQLISESTSMPYQRNTASMLMRWLRKSSK